KLRTQRTRRATGPRPRTRFTRSGPCGVLRKAGTTHSAVTPMPNSTSRAPFGVCMVRPSRRAQPNRRSFKSSHKARGMALLSRSVGTNGRLRGRRRFPDGRALGQAEEQVLERLARLHLVAQLGELAVQDLPAAVHHEQVGAKVLDQRQQVRT